MIFDVLRMMQLATGNPWKLVVVSGFAAQVSTLFSDIWLNRVRSSVRFCMTPVRMRKQMRVVEIEHAVGLPLSSLN